MPYRHTQSGALMLWILAAAGAFVFAVTWLASGEPFNTIVLIVLAVLAVVGYLFSSLTVEVDAPRLSWHFGSGFWKKSVVRGDIVAVEIAQMKWWYGYGIRITPRGWLYRVSGNDAVGVTLASGKTLFIGTDEPDKLAAALSPRPSY